MLKMILSLATVTASTLGSAANLRATNCEIFIETARLTVSAHALTQLELRVKIRPTLLDAPVKDVGLLQIRHTIWRDPQATGPTSPAGPFPKDGVAETALVPFFGAPDYFTTPKFLTLSHLWGNWSLEVAPFVTTVKGTRYYANPADGSNFKLNSALVAKLRDIRGMYPTITVNTSDEELAPLLNPAGCR